MKTNIYFQILGQLLRVAVAIWPLFALLAAVFVLALMRDWVKARVKSWDRQRHFRAGEEWRSNQELLQWLRGMKPSKFETYIADMFSRLGYSARAVGKSHDGGIDVIVEKDGITNYIQCKKFITQQVTVGAVRDFYGSLADHLAKGQGYFITTNVFTLEARQFAADKPIELIDGARLVEYIRLTEKQNKTDPQTEVPVQETTVCPKCGGKLIEKNGKYGRFMGCSNYPKCDYSTHV